MDMVQFVQNLTAEERDELAHAVRRMPAEQFARFLLVLSREDGVSNRLRHPMIMNARDLLELQQSDMTSSELDRRERQMQG